MIYIVFQRFSIELFTFILEMIDGTKNTPKFIRHSPAFWVYVLYLTKLVKIERFLEKYEFQQV